MIIIKKTTVHWSTSHWSVLQANDIKVLQMPSLTWGQPNHVTWIIAHVRIIAASKCVSCFTFPTAESSPSRGTDRRPYAHTSSRVWSQRQSPEKQPNVGSVESQKETQYKLKNTQCRQKAWTDTKKCWVTQVSQAERPLLHSRLTVDTSSGELTDNNNIISRGRPVKPAAW